MPQSVIIPEMISAEVRTRRLLLIPSTPTLLKLEMSDVAEFARAIGAAVPSDWPPGEYDREAMAFFLQKMNEGGPGVVGWYGWYVIKQGEKSEEAQLVGTAGYLGPPDETGSVEIGYSISGQWRGQGIATEVVQALVAKALANGASGVIAHAGPANAGSIQVLTRCGFQKASDSDRSMLTFEYSETRAQ